LKPGAKTLGPGVLDGVFGEQERNDVVEDAVATADYGLVLSEGLPSGPEAGTEVLFLFVRR
jgi:hypothetical protein